MSINLKLQTAIHIALSVSAGALAVSYVPLAAAQDADTQDLDEGTIEEVIVTGSRIRRADIDSASPVTVLAREEIEATGLTDVGSLLQRMPSMSGSPIGTTTNNGGNGTVLVDLRGMGTNRTVTLINGQRMVDGGDYQTVPSTMIERVEVLKDGASAVYGADAVSGVVNIITRRDFQGMEVSAQQADWFDSAGKQYTFGLIAGSEFESGNVVLGLEYVNQEEAYQRDVPWAFMQDSYYVYPAGCETHPTLPYTGSPNDGCYQGGSSRIPEASLRFLTQGRFMVPTAASEPYQAGLMEVFDGRNYNFAPVNYLQTPYERYNLFSEAHFDINDNVRFNAEVRANFRESAQELAPMPFDTRPGLDPAHSGVFNGVAYNGVNPDNYYLRQAVDLYNAANGTSLVYEPITDLRRRMIEGPRRFTQDVTQFQYVTGLEGSFNEDLDWDVFLNQGWRSRNDMDVGQLNGPALQNALGPSADLNGDGIPECYGDINDPGSLIVGCVPLNVFGGGSVDRATGIVTGSSVTQDMLDYVSAPLTDWYETKQTIWGANLTGSMFELPGGALGWAVGYSYWKQEYQYQPDSGKFSDTVSGNTGLGTDGTLTNNAVYGEVLAPLYDNGTQELILKAGLRYDDYDAFDGDTTYQLGLEFQVVENVKLRGTYGTVFRAPSISELFGGTVDSFPTYEDPCAVPANELPPGCAQVAVQDDTQVLAKVGGNPNLIPETGDTYTAGVVWTPTFGDHGFTATFDYWTIDLEDAISSLGVDYILDSCYIEQNAASCALVTRRTDGTYAVQQILNGQLNVAEQGAEGVDTEIRWNWTSSFGQWEASMLWSHLLERSRVQQPGAEEEDLSGRYTDPTAQDGGSRPENKINYSLQWMWNDLSIGYLGEYIDSQLTTALLIPEYEYTIPDRLYHDLVATYTFSELWGGGLQLSGGITNITDEDPPFFDLGFNASTDPTAYRLFGIGYYVRASWKF
jgi:outer membrane receptor protein involved in Fe transport